MTVYRSTRTSRTVTDARTALETHCPDPVTGRCAACGSALPCQAANLAANQLADMGALEPVPVAAPPLLTYGWRVAFGFRRSPTPTPSEEQPAIEDEYR